MKPSDPIWPGSVRAFVRLCFLVLTLIFVTDLDHFMHQAHNHAVNTKFRQQEKIFLQLKERITLQYPVSSCTDDQGDESKA